jgi:hypothetical protein
MQKIQSTTDDDCRHCEEPLRRSNPTAARYDAGLYVLSAVFRAYFVGHGGRMARSFLDGARARKQSRSVILPDGLEHER